MVFLVCDEYGSRVGEDYDGCVNEAENGATCLNWDNNVLTYNPTDYPDKNLIENYCRNPDGDVNGPWCYVKLENSDYKYCDIRKRFFIQRKFMYLSLITFSFLLILCLDKMLLLIKGIVSAFLHKN
jgi:hypothetical protein